MTMRRAHKTCHMYLSKYCDNPEGSEEGDFVEKPKKKTDKIYRGEL